MNARILAVLLLAAAAGCTVDNSASVVLSKACFPPTPETGGGCVYPAICDSVMLGNLWVDPSFFPAGATPLVWPIQVDNQRPDNAATDAGGTTTSTAYVTGYKLSYASAAVAVPPATVSWTTQSVPPLGSTVVIVPVIPATVRASLLGLPSPTQLLVEIRATGHYGDDTTFETGPFSMVVSVMNGTGAGASCPLATPTLVGVCPQEGQSGVALCE